MEKYKGLRTQKQVYFSEAASGLKENLGKTPLILVVSTKFNPHVDILINQLNKKGISFVRFNTEDFPLKSSATIFFEGISHKENLHFPNNPLIKGSDITAVWYRRPAPFEFPSEFSPAIHVFAEKETRATINGLWQLLDCLWVNHPEKNRIAEIKLNQLKKASQLGLEIPKTMVTNNPEQARKFFKSTPRKIIIKCLSGGLIDNDMDSTAIYSSIVKERNLKTIQNIKYTPVLLQEYTDKQIELRITVVGEKIFASEIHSQKNKKTINDWRRDTLNLKHKEHKLPQEIEKKCLNLVKCFELNFGAIDMIISTNDHYVFLEINPNGQWAWIEDLTGMPISESLASLLIRGL